MSKKYIFLALVAVLTFGYATSAKADHAWGNYHWARTSNPFTLKLGNNLSRNWQTQIKLASTDWSASSVMDTIVAKTFNKRGKCQAYPGRVEVCDSAYGNNGWLGLATVWSNGDHITQGLAQFNNTYFSTPDFNKPEWKQSVMCQEIGHTFGLDHQDEDFNNPNLQTCMDYSGNPIDNQHPNAHDYGELETIYAHLDGNTTISQAMKLKELQSLEMDVNDKSEWGNKVKTSKNGKVSVYERDFGDDIKVSTFVIWADPELAEAH